VKNTIVSCLAIAGLAIILSAQPAAARDVPIGGMTAQDVASWLQAAGYSATIKPDPTTPGDQIITTAISGINFDVYMYACTNGRCRSLQYAAGWNLSSPAGSDITDKLLSWNREKRYVRAYLSSSGKSYWGEFDIDIYPGGTYEALDHSLERFGSVISDFKTYMGQ
jgi:hypothetical protein